MAVLIFFWFSCSFFLIISSRFSQHYNQRCIHTICHWTCSKRTSKSRRRSFNPISRSILFNQPDNYKIASHRLFSSSFFDWISQRFVLHTTTTNHHYLLASRRRELGTSKQTQKETKVITQGRNKAAKHSLSPPIVVKELKTKSRTLKPLIKKEDSANQLALAETTTAETETPTTKPPNQQSRKGRRSGTTKDYRRI